jgi:hypothetical protein
MHAMGEAIRTDVPARLDRLRWSRFDTLLIAALGTSWIIDGLEVSRRGLYGGVVGYFDFAGDSDTAIAIRTAVVRDGIAYVQAGAGVVADSIPANEDAESVNKAAAVLGAVIEAAGLSRLVAGS